MPIVKNLPIVKHLKKLPWLGLALVLLLQGCETVPADSDVVEANTILVFPADSLHKELEKFSPDVQQRLAKAIRKQGFKVKEMPAADYAAIHAEALTVSGSMYEPSVGKQMPLNPAAYDKALVDLAREKQAFDIAVIPELVLRSAKTEGDQAEWDGVKREYTWIKKPKETFTLPRRGSGLSLHMGVYTDSGSKVVHNYAGISLPYDLQLEDGKFLFQLKDPFFTNSELQDSIDLSAKTFRQHVRSSDD